MALRLVAAVVEGLGSSDRNLAALHTDALKAADKCLKDKSVSTANKSAAGAVIKAVAEAGGSGLWSSAGSAFDDIVRTCILALVDPSITVREVFAAALGEIAAASNASSAKEAVRRCPCADVSSHACREFHIVCQLVCICRADIASITACVPLPLSSFLPHHASLPRCITLSIVLGLIKMHLIVHAGLAMPCVMCTSLCVLCSQHHDCAVQADHKLHMGYKAQQRNFLDIIHGADSRAGQQAQQEGRPGTDGLTSCLHLPDQAPC